MFSADSVRCIRKGNGGGGGVSAIRNASTVGCTERIGCAVKPDGSVVGWTATSDSYSILSSIASWSDIQLIECGYYNVYGLTSSGHIVAAGNDNNGQITNKPTDGGYIDIAAGYDHAIGLKSDGTLTIWGRNAVGEGAVIPGLAFVEMIFAGGRMSGTIDVNKTLRCWGVNSYGQLSADGMTDVYIASMTSENVIAVKNSGYITVTGSNRNGFIDNIPSDIISVDGNDENYNTVAISIASSGIVTRWGGESSIPTYTAPAIAAKTSKSGCVILSTDGSVSSFGLGTPPANLIAKIPG